MTQLWSMVQQRAEYYLQHCPAELLKDVPAMMAALKHEQTGIPLTASRWLGMSFSGCFKGHVAVARLQELTKADEDACLQAAASLCELGCYHHTFRHFKFSTTCFFFWSKAAELNGVLVAQELLSQQPGDPLRDS
jgi:predicted naringenin-chalcone synthase